MNRRNLQLLAQTRLAEAQALLRAGLPSGAYYLAGYAVECALKACIAKSTQRYDFPDKQRVNASHAHSLKDLLRIANLEAAHKVRITNPSFSDNWDLVQAWSEHSRYETHTAEAAQALVEAVANRKHGVLKWVKRYW